MDLFISDLDGTLLNNNQEISDYSKNVINSLIDNGLNFSIATARSICSSKGIIKDLNLKLPIVLNNGVFIYDPVNKKNIKSNFLDIEAFVLIKKEFKDINFIVFTEEETGNKVYYKDITNFGEKHYIQGRLSEKDKRFNKVNVNEFDFKNKIITVNLINTKEILDDIYKELLMIEGIYISYSQDIYSKFYWLEIISKNASKKNAVLFLKNYLNTNSVTCFGDNINDLPMFEACENKIAVINAVIELKRQASLIIESNETDSVAKYLYKIFAEINNKK